MRWPRPLAGDVRGGITAAIVDLGLLLTYGLLAFGALGVEHADRGILAAFVASIFGGLVANLLGSAAIPGSGPRASSTLILATFVAALVADGSVPAAGLPSVEAVFFLAAACVALAGLIQLAFAVARLGSLVKFVPHPVVSGFMNGIAILIVISQLPNLLGVPSPPLVGGWVEAIGAAQAGTVFIGLAAAAVVWIVTWRWPRAPAALVAVVAGVLLYHGLAASIPSLQLGPLLEPVAGRLPPPTALAPIVSDAGWNLMRTHWADVVGTAFVIATVGSLDSLLAAAGADVAHGTRHDANRELAGQGFGNVVSGLLGGLPITFSQARPRRREFFTDPAAIRASPSTEEGGGTHEIVLQIVPPGWRCNRAWARGNAAGRHRPRCCCRGARQRPRRDRRQHVAQRRVARRSDRRRARYPTR
jgi:SulP family sulfate permease